jgi:plastocyanin
LAIVLFVAPTASARQHPPGHVTPNKLTINVTQNPILTGDAVTLYGQLNVANKANRVVVLWHRLPNQRYFTRVQKVRTDAAGFWKIDRAENVVITNRSWFVTVARLRSRTIHERVQARVTLSGPSGVLLTGPAHKVTFTGHVDPNHRGERVYLQRQDSGNGDRWTTIDHTRLDHLSDYKIRHTFRNPGSASLRVLFKGDRRNIRSVSSSISVEIQQAQNPKLTLSPSAYSIDYGGSVTLSGVLAGPDNATKTVTLLSRQANQQFHQIATTTTDANGAYSFPLSPAHNALYRSEAAGKKSAQVAVGVHDVVTINPAGPVNSTAGDTVTFTGTVSPDKTGHTIELQKVGQDGKYHTIRESRVQSGSTYRFVHRLGSPGTKVFRVLITGGPYNQRGVSSSVTVNVAPKQQP